jgi:2-hydroxy-3-oxopropionate reductase
MPETVGFIGLGVMGRPMAKNLLKGGYKLVVHSRSPEPVQDLVAAGATAATSPKDVAAQSDVIITMVPDAPDVQKVLTGPDGVFESMKPGSVIVDMSTISPVVAKDLAQQAAQRGASMLDAPVSGGEVGAINGQLSIMVGGDAATLERVRPILEKMGNPEKIVHIGESGAGQLCKACNQLVIGGALAAVSEAFALARKAGVDAAKVREALMGGFAASRVLEVHGQRMLDENWKPGFRTRLYQKDFRIVMMTAGAYEVPMPTGAVISQLVNAAVVAGHGDDDYASVALVLRRLAGVE